MIGGIGQSMESAMPRSSHCFIKRGLAVVINAYAHRFDQLLTIGISKDTELL